jgi:hypothetical protein
MQFEYATSVIGVIHADARFWCQVDIGVKRTIVADVRKAADIEIVAFEHRSQMIDGKNPVCIEFNALAADRN